MNLRHRKQRGFTLVELMVVVAVIALLIGILLTALLKARKSARIVVCTSNVRQIGVAWNSYLTHYDDEFPFQTTGGRHLTWFYGGKDPVITSLSGSTFKRPLNPFVDIDGDQTRVMNLFRCTEDRDIRNGLTGGPGPTKGYACFDYYGNSYLMNWQLLMYPEKPNHYVPTKRTQVDLSPSWVMMLGDCQWYYTVNDTYWDANFHNHKDKLNMLFLDGHAKYTQMVRGKSTTADYTVMVRKKDMDQELAQEEEPNNP